jgi:hypothetical protein
MKYSKWIVVTALVLLTASESFAQQPAALPGPFPQVSNDSHPRGCRWGLRGGPVYWALEV